MQRRADVLSQARERSAWNPIKWFGSTYGEEPSYREEELAKEIRMLRNAKYVLGSNGWQLTKRWQERADQAAAKALLELKMWQAYYKYLNEKEKRGEKLTSDEIMWKEGFIEGGANPFLRTPAQVGDIDPIDVIGGLAAGGLCRSAVRAPSSALSSLPSPGKSLLSRASDSRLRNAIANLYRRNARIGSGSTMDAVRFEKATGQLLSPTGHVQKLLDRRNQLMSLLGDSSIGRQDRAIIKEILIDMQEALSMIR